MFRISGERGITGNDPSSWFGPEERLNYHQLLLILIDLIILSLLKDLSRNNKVVLYFSH